jgi:hypothetical protein
MLLLLFFTYGAQSICAQEVEERTVEKSYTVNSDATLAVNNERGNIMVTTWEKSQLDIMVRIKVKGDDPDFLRKRVDEVKLYFSHSADRVEARTEIGEQGWWSWLWGQESQIEVHYTIFMPVDGNVQLTNDYGDVSIDTLNGFCDINCDYGNVTLGHINGRAELNLDYSQKSRIGYAQELEMNVDYSKITVDSAGRGEVNADYCTVIIGKVDRLDYNGDYGALKVNQAHTVLAYADYVDVELGELSKQLDYKADYGSLDVDRILPNFDRISIKSDYVSIYMGLHPDAAFRVHGEESFTSLSMDQGIQLNTDAGKGISSDFSGYYLHPNAAALIEAKMSYGKLNIRILE